MLAWKVLPHRNVERSTKLHFHCVSFFSRIMQVIAGIDLTAIMAIVNIELENAEQEIKTTEH